VKSWELQQAVYTALTGAAPLMAIVSAVYDHVPQTAVYPYVVIGEDQATPVDADDLPGADHLIDIHVWSGGGSGTNQDRGQKKVKQAQGAIYAALHRQTLAVTGAAFLTCDLEHQQTFLDADGLTHHGVQRFRVKLDEVD
jgi:hypothetical protein